MADVVADATVAEGGSEVAGGAGVEVLGFFL